MKIRNTISILILTLFLISCKHSNKEKEIQKSLPELIHSEIGFSLPDSVKIINDYGHIFTEKQRTELNKRISEYIINTTKEFIIVTVDSIKPYKDIQKFATDLGNDWGIGAPKWNNGLTIVLCKPCKKIGIATGTGTELILTDEICKEVIENTIIPEFKKGKIYLGINKGIVELITKWE
jgi:uncharacterized protein